jgi:lipopolysaccharide export system protein LptC
VKFRINNLLPLVMVLMLAMLTLWLRQAAEIPTQEADRAGKNDPDAVVENLTITRLGETGTAQYTMAAKRMLHFPLDDSTVLESPRFEKRSADGVTLVVTATRGTLIDKTQEAFFNGDVLLIRSTPGGQPALQARTEFLHVMTAKDLVSTNRHVTITQGARTLSGVGMEINKLTRQISLQSQVKGHYDVARRK